MKENKKNEYHNITEEKEILELSKSTTKMDQQDQQNPETKLKEFIDFLNSSDQKLKYSDKNGDIHEISGQEFLNKYIKDLFHYDASKEFEFNHNHPEKDVSMKDLIRRYALQLRNISELLNFGFNILFMICCINNNFTDPILSAFMNKYQDVIGIAWHNSELAERMLINQLILSNEAIDAIFSNFNYYIEQTRKKFKEEYPNKKFQIDPKLEDISAFEKNDDADEVENEGSAENSNDKSNQEKKSPIELYSVDAFILVCKIIARLIKNQALLAQQKKQDVRIGRAWFEINKIESVKQAFSTIVSNYGETIEKYFENIDRIECKDDIEFNNLKQWLDQGRCKFTVKDGRLDLIPDEKKISAFERLNWNFDKLMLAMEENKLLAFSLSLGGLLSAISTVVFALNIWLEFAKFALVSTAATAASVAVPAVVLVVCIVAIYFMSNSKNRKKPPKEGSKPEDKVPFEKKDEIYKDQNGNKEDLLQDSSSSSSSSLPKVEDSKCVDDDKNENNNENTEKNIGGNIGGNSDNKENNEESKNNNLDNKEKPEEEGKNYEKE